MIPVTQTELYDPSRPNHRGNCWQAVIASVLELPLEEVPHFVQEEVDHGMADEWHWFTRTIDWLREHGYVLRHRNGGEAPDEYRLVTGPSPRGNGIHHVVIYRGEEMVHDPHPDRTGLVGVSGNANGYVIQAAEEDS